MHKLIAIIATAFVAASALAAGQSDSAKLSKSEKERLRLEKTGGMITKKGEGKAVIVNQNILSLNVKMQPVIVVHSIQCYCHWFHYTFDELFLRHRSVGRQFVFQRSVRIIIHHVIICIGFVALEDAARSTHVASGETGE